MFFAWCQNATKTNPHMLIDNINGESGMLPASSAAKNTMACAGAAGLYHQDRIEWINLFANMHAIGRDVDQPCGAGQR